MKTGKIVFVVLFALVCFVSLCIAQSDDKGPVNIPKSRPVDNDNKGPVTLKAVVPNVVGKKYGEAKPILESAGFTVKATGQVFSKVNQRTVTKQTPAGGTAAAKGSSVTCYIQ